MKRLFASTCFCLFLIGTEAQLPINRMSYLNKSTPAPDSSVHFSFSEVNTFFLVHQGADTGIATVALDAYLSQLEKALENPEKNINPFLAFAEANLLDSIQKRINNLSTRTQQNAEASGTPLMSITSTEKLGGFDMWYKRVKKLKLAYYGVNQILGTPKMSALLFPARNSTEAALIYQKYSDRLFQVGSNISLFGWENRGSINPELFSFYVGPLRMAANTLLATTDSSQEVSELTKLRTLTGNGGNLVFSIYYPFFHINSSGFSAFSHLNVKSAFEMPILGSPFSTDTLYRNYNAGLDLNLSIHLPILGGSKFFYYLRPAYLMGSEPYAAALNARREFFLMQHAMGLDVQNIGRIGFSLPPVTSVRTLRSNSFLLSFQLLTSNVK